MNAAGAVALQDFTDYLNSSHPEVPNIPTGKKGAAKEANDPKNVIISSGAKAEKVLGIKYRTIQETAADSESSPTTYPPTALGRLAPS